MVGAWRRLGSRSRSPGLQPRCRPAGAVRSAGSRSSMEEPRRATVAEEAAGDGRINLAVARVSGKAEQAPQSGRRSGYSGKLRKGARVSHRRWPEMAGDRPAPGGGGEIAWAGAGSWEKRRRENKRWRGLGPFCLGRVGRPGQLGFGLLASKPQPSSG
jgi:hypothetical protein